MEGIGRCRCPKACGAYGTHPTVRAGMPAYGCPDYAARSRRGEDEDRANRSAKAFRWSRQYREGSSQWEA